MRRRPLLVAALTCLSALAVANHQRPRRAHHPESRLPSQLRGNPMARLPTGPHSGAEAAARTRAAVAEAARVRGATRGRFSPDAISVAGTNWVNLGPTDAPQEVQLLLDRRRRLRPAQQHRGRSTRRQRRLHGRFRWRRMEVVRLLVAVRADVGTDDGSATQPRGRSAHARSRSSRHGVRRQRRLRRHGR